MPRGNASRWDSRLPSAKRATGRWPAAIIHTLLVLSAALAASLAAPSQHTAVSAAPLRSHSDHMPVAHRPPEDRQGHYPRGVDGPQSTPTPARRTATLAPTATAVPPTPTETSTPTVTPTPTATPPPPWRRYNVRSGENLTLIGRQFGVAIDSLSVANGLARPNLIFPGQSLYIPPSGWKPPWLDKKQQEEKAAVMAAALPWLRYTVRRGDALSVIAQSYNVDMNTLAVANGISSPERIVAGQVLHIPPKGWKIGMPKPQDRPTSVQASFPALPRTPATQGTYTVRAGDNLTGIASRYGVSAQALATANKLRSQDLIYVGQSLAIPGRGPAGGSTLASGFSYAGSGDESVVAPPSMSPESIDRILAQYNSPAEGTGLTFYSLGVQYGIDPAYALAFFIHESSGGTQGVARFTRSIGNIRHTPGYRSIEGFRAYDSWEAGIADWYQLIVTEYVQNWGLSTVSQIVPVYAPAVENDVPGYINAVMNLVYSWRGSGGYFDALGGSGLRANLVPRAFHVTSEFGHYPDGSAHYGLDLDAGWGIEQTAPVGGVVVEVISHCGAGDPGCGRGLGNQVWWRSAATGNYIAVGHLAEVNPALQEGAIIGAGMVLGVTGATGWATGPHVHIQVNPTGPYNDGSIDPSWEFPWLVCGSTSPGLGEPWGNAGCE